MLGSSALGLDSLSGDADNDGVPDEVDKCVSSVIPFEDPARGYRLAVDPMTGCPFSALPATCQTDFAPPRILIGPDPAFPSNYFFELGLEARPLSVDGHP
jgi:hypothetical protein